MKKSNQLKIQLKGGDESLKLDQQIRTLLIHSRQGEIGTLTLTANLSPLQMKDLSLTQIAKTISVEWNGSCYFNGESTGVEAVNHNTIKIHFQDCIHRLAHIYPELEIKGMKLSQVLKKIVQQIPNVSEVKFRTPELFDESLPYLNFGHRSAREILDELAEYYGFTYMIRYSQSGAIFCFLRSGNSFNSKAITLDFKTPMNSLSVSHKARSKYKTVSVSLADVSFESQKKQLKSQDLQSALSLYSPGSDLKNSFEFEYSEIDFPVSHRETFAQFEKIIPYQYARKVEQTDELTVTLFEPLLKVGDSFSVDSSFSKYLDRSVHQVIETALLITGSQPKLKILAVRP